MIIDLLTSLTLPVVYAVLCCVRKEGDGQESGYAGRKERDNSSQSLCLGTVKFSAEVAELHAPSAAPTSETLSTTIHPSSHRALARDRNNIYCGFFFSFFFFFLHSLGPSEPRTSSCRTKATTAELPGKFPCNKLHR